MVEIFYSFVKKEKSKEMLKHILKKYYSIESEVLYTAQGKPYLEKGEKHFSISHSGEMVIMAFSDSPVGIDIELIKNRDYQKISQKYFIEQEQSRISSLESFLVVWTKKESFLKYTGDGLAKIKDLVILDDIVFCGEKVQVNSFSELFDDYIFTLTTTEESYEKYLLM